MSSSSKRISASVAWLYLAVAPAIAQTTHFDKLKPEFVAVMSRVPGTSGYYNSREEAFASFQTWFAETCPAGAVCTVGSLHACPADASQSYHWGQPNCWRWQEQVTRNGVVTADGFGSMSWNPTCPTASGYSMVSNRISGDSVVPRSYENFCSAANRVPILPNACRVGNPIYPANGTKGQSEKDYASANGALTFTRTYNSAYGRFRSEYEVDFVAPGQALSSSCLGDEIRIEGNNGVIRFPRCFTQMNPDVAGGKALYVGADGARDEVIWHEGTGLGTSTAPYFKNRLLRATVNGTQGWLMAHPSEGRYLAFDSTGRLQFVQKISGAKLTLSYAGGVVTAVTDQMGRALQMAQGPQGLVSVTDPSGLTTQYAYAQLNQLRSVTYPDNSVKTYVWDEPTWSTGAQTGVNRLTGIVDESNRRYASFGYLAGKAVSTEYAGAVQKYSIVDSRSNGSGSIALTAPLGSIYATTYALINGYSRPVAQDQPSGSGCAASSSALGYDANGNVASRDDFAGNRSCYGHDLSRNLETVRVQGLSTTASCGTATAAGASLSTGARKVSTAWHPDWQLATRVAEPGRIVTSVYNGQPDPFNANAIASCAPASALLPDGKPIAVLCKRVEQATTDANGALGFTASLQSGVANRVTTWTYNQWGQVLTENGPRVDVNDTTTYAYYSDTSFTGEGAAAEGHYPGDLATVTNATGKVTQYTKYNKHGQVLESVDPNGIVTRHTYDLRQRLLSTTVGGQATSYQYDPVGQLKRVTLPDQSWIGYDYDDAHRQVAVYDHKGNRTDYVLDNAGNRIAENTRDPGGALKRQLSRSVDALGRVQQTTGRE